MVRNARRCLGAERTVLVTDSVSAAGMPDGEYHLSGSPVRLSDGVVRDREGRLAGSALTMARAAENYLEAVPDADATELARVTSTNPARILGLADRGAIAPGAVAEFAVLTPDRRLARLEL